MYVMSMQQQIPLRRVVVLEVGIGIFLDTVPEAGHLVAVQSSVRIPYDGRGEQKRGKNCMPTIIVLFLEFNIYITSTYMRFVLSVLTYIKTFSYVPIGVFT